MKYMLLIYADPEGFAALNPAEAQAAIRAASLPEALATRLARGR